MVWLPYTAIDQLLQALRESSANPNNTLVRAAKVGAGVDKVEGSHRAALLLPSSSSRSCVTRWRITTRRSAWPHRIVCTGANSIVSVPRDSSLRNDGSWVLFSLLFPILRLLGGATASIWCGITAAVPLPCSPHHPLKFSVFLLFIVVVLAEL